jgi:hypothetical protein
MFWIIFVFLWRKSSKTNPIVTFQGPPLYVTTPGCIFYEFSGGQSMKELLYLTHIIYWKFEVIFQNAFAFKFSRISFKILDAFSAMIIFETSLNGQKTINNDKMKIW